MKRSKGQKLSDAEVARVEKRRKALNLTDADLVARFAAALKTAGCVHAIGSAKMRLDRVINPRMRRPVSDSTKLALARALEWKVEEFDRHIQRLPRTAQTTETAQFSTAGATRSELERVADLLCAQAEVLRSIASTLPGTTQ